jgi:hypothetical protein
MYSVHKFMDLSAAEVGYFITQVANSAASFGVASADLTVVGTALETVFDVMCGPATTIVPAQGPQLQSICIGDGCALAVNATCNAYNSTPFEPANATSPASSGSPSSTGSASAGTSPTGTSTSGATAFGLSFAALMAGAFAILL